MNEIKTPKLENAQQWAANNPATFKCPSLDEIQEYITTKEKPSVQVCFGGERFWLRSLILIPKTCNMVGTIDNDLVKTRDHGLKFNDVILLANYNIYKIQNIDI